MASETIRASRSVVLIGGPDAGKTNYICRLWLAIKSANGLLRPAGLPDHLDYLEAGAEELLGGNFAPHTPSGVHHECVIPFEHASTSGTTKGQLVVPDCPGESWIQVYKTRHWSDMWERLIEEGCGCLVFLRADSDQIIPHLDWINCVELFGKPLDESAPEYDTPTQVVITDWLQCLRQAFTRRVRGNYMPRIGIVIAAWDLLPTDQQQARPDDYLNENFPLLSQFIRANGHRFHFATFGLSVMGGDPQQ